MPLVGGHSRGRRIRRWPARAATALMAVGAAIAMVSAGGAATVTSARLTSVASTPGGDPAAGTVKAQVTQPQQATVRHAAMTSSAAATGSLSTVLSESVHGGYTATGTGMRNLGYGTISITGIPAGATVKSATLLWDILADSAGPSFAQGSLDGEAFTGTPWASGASPCWSAGANFSYEADVTSLVTGNGSYKLTGFATGQSDGADPWTSGSTAPLDEGASLVVVYELPSMPEVTVQIAEGATETPGDTASATLDGFTVGAKASASTTYIVADGQMPGNTASFDGTTLPGVSFPGNDPQAVPHYSQGNLWDTVTTDVSSYLSPGDTSATIGVTGGQDCLVWVGQVLSVSTGAVLAFGDSVAAGYGLGPSEGFPDNPDAYSAVLAQKLGYDSQNYAVEGVCAGIGNDCPAHSVDWQIQQVPASFTPSLITLTVGANDINFGGCLESIIENGDESMHSLTDPCNPATLSRHLADFKGKLANDLTTLQGKYPGVPIQVMDYYNPLPPAPAAKQSACLFSDVATLTYEHAQIGWLNTVDTFILHQSKFNSDARTVQGLLYKDAQTVLNQLNTAINTTANGHATVVNTNDFAGHDICAQGSEWVFSPTFAIDMSLKVGSVSKSAHLEIGGDEVCPDPVSSVDKNFKISEQFKNTFLHISGSLNIAGGLNCLPHPTVAGQTAIADDFLNQGA
jgi:lysophospholipase L1-like esterase